jgi:hypothetical protein
MLLGSFYIRFPFFLIRNESQVSLMGAFSFRFLEGHHGENPRQSRGYSPFFIARGGEEFMGFFPFRHGENPVSTKGKTGHMCVSVAPSVHKGPDGHFWLDGFGR